LRKPWRCQPSRSSPRVLQGSGSIAIDIPQLDPRAIESYEKAGVERSVFFLPPEGRDKVMPMLDRCAKMMTS